MTFIWILLGMATAFYSWLLWEIAHAKPMPEEEKLSEELYQAKKVRTKLTVHKNLN